MRELPYSIWTREVVSLSEDGKLVRVRPAIHQAFSSTEEIAVRRVGGFAHRDILRGITNVVEVRGPSGVATRVFYKRGYTSERGGIVSIGSHGVAEYEGALEEVPW